MYQAHDSITSDRCSTQYSEKEYFSVADAALRYLAAADLRTPLLERVADHPGPSLYKAAEYRTYLT